MGINELIMTDKLKEKWIYFQSLIDEYDSLTGKMRAIISDISAYELLLNILSDDEKNQINEYLNKVNK